MDFNTYFTQASFGGILGFAVGYASKKILKILLLLLGLVIIVLQIFNYYDLIVIKWNNIILLKETWRINWQDIKKVLFFNIPFGSVFIVSFWIGFKYG